MAAAAAERASVPPKPTPTPPTPTPPTPPPAAAPPAAARERHVSWLRRGAADARGSPFHELGLAARGDEEQAGRAPKRRNYARLEQPRQGAAAADAAAARSPAQPSAGDRAAASPPVFLDVGCGSGRFLLLLSRRLRQLRRSGPASGGGGAAPTAAATAPAPSSAAPMMQLLLAGLERRAASPSRLQLVGLDAQPALVARANAWAAALEREGDDDDNEEEGGEGDDDEEEEGGEGDDDDDEAPGGGGGGGGGPFGCRFVAGDASELLVLDDGLGTGSPSPLPLIAAASINFPDPVLMDRSRGGIGRNNGGGAAPSSRADSARRRRCPALSVEFADILAARMAPGAPLMVQSECPATARALVEAALLGSGWFEAVAPPPPALLPREEGAPPAPPARAGLPWWCWDSNPLGVPTEREVYLAERRARAGERHDVWRALLVRK